MTADLTHQLQTAASSTFEQLGFLLPEKHLTDQQSQASVTGSCRVRFRGPHSGALEIEVAGRFLAELANNMLGEESEPPQEIVMDALGEITNVICGNVLPSLSGPNAVYDLSAPETSPGPLPVGARATSEHVANLSLGLDEGRAEITIRLYG